MGFSCFLGCYGEPGTQVILLPQPLEFWDSRPELLFLLLSSCPPFFPSSSYFLKNISLSHKVAQESLISLSACLNFLFAGITGRAKLSCPAFLSVFIFVVFGGTGL
jgi:hypothetical protein